MILLISYDLNGRERPAAYETVKKAIESNSISSRRPLYSQWLVETTESPDTWSTRLKGVTDSNDSWFIVRVQRPYQGWLNQDIWDWLNPRV